MKAESPLIRTIELKDRNGRVVGRKEFVTYSGLLAKAHDEGLMKIATTLVQTPSDDNGRVAIVRAEVETAKGIFQGYGDASPDNVNAFIVPHLIRMAETRAKARALRDAVNIGVISFEELDGDGFPPGSPDLGSDAPSTIGVTRPASNGSARVPARSATSTSSGSDRPSLMSDSQRRYLLKLLAERGLQGDAANEYLMGELAVTNLGEVTRKAATRLIDHLVGGFTGTNGVGPRR